MPCHLITYHAYCSWMPDHRRGYVRRGQGIRPPDEDLAARYRRNATDRPVRFDASIQQTAMDELHRSARCQHFTLLAVGSDPTHLHVLARWRDDRSPKHMQTIVKSSLTRKLNAEFGRRRWFSENASNKAVRDEAHRDYLVNEYLPSHRGLFFKAPSC